MHLLLFFLMSAAPFWETLAPRQWSDEQLDLMLRDSPWAQVTTFRGDSPVAVYLATARPMRDAEAEYQRRYALQTGPRVAAEHAAAREEYQEFLAQNEGKVIVIGIRNPNLLRLAESEESKLMQEESVLRAGRKKLKVSGHFPPVPSDPVLRLVFPRPGESVKDLNFELYIPGFSGPYRQAPFRTKDLVYKGKIEM